MDSLLASINDSIGKTLWSTVRALEEHMLLRHLALRQSSEEGNL